MKTMYFVDSLQKGRRGGGEKGGMVGGERGRKEGTALTCTSKYVVICYSFKLKRITVKDVVEETDVK